MPHRYDSKRIAKYLRKEYAGVNWPAQVGAIAVAFFRQFDTPELIASRLRLDPEEVILVTQRLEEIYATDEAFVGLIHSEQEDWVSSLAELEKRYDRELIQQAFGAIAEHRPRGRTRVEEIAYRESLPLELVRDVAALMARFEGVDFDFPDDDSPGWGCRLKPLPFMPRGPQHAKRPGNEAPLLRSR